VIDVASTSALPDHELTVAEQQIDLAVTLAELCERPPRWQGRPRPTVDPVTCAFFLISGSSVAWVDAAAAHPRIRAVDVSIEAMGTFAAIEASIATGRVQVVICGSGPGTVGVLWAIPAARSQGASLLVLAPCTPPGLVGAVDIQESSYYQPSHTAGAALYDDVIPMTDPLEMPRIALRVRHLFARRQGAVVQLCVPTNLHRRACPPLPDLAAVESTLPAPSAATIARVARLLSGPGGPPAFLFGSGAVAFRDRLGELVERWGAVHLTTPTAVGLLPGSLGFIGNATYGDIPARLRELDVRCLVVLGSRLGIASGGGDRGLLPEDCQVVHVDVDPSVIAGNPVALWGHPVLHVLADIAEFVDALLAIRPVMEAAR
jgi:thiamine pyrophosphate-dependent acetolactate synthase large subunit-like protein